MALDKLKKWVGTQAMTAFFDQLNDNVDATNAAIDAVEQNVAKFKIGSFVRTIATASGTQAITGIGFKPKAIIALATVQLVEGVMSIGMWAEGGSSMGLFDTYKNVANSYGKGGLVHIRLGAGSSYDYSCSVQSADNDGFTLIWTKGANVTGGGNIDVMYLALR